MNKNLISINNCRIENSKSSIISSLSWNLKSGEAWLVIGPNGGGKADFLNALSNVSGIKITPNEGIENTSLFSSVFGKNVEIVSLERAARLIQEERENDESDYLEGGVDIGRTGRIFIAEGIIENQKDSLKTVTETNFKAQVQADKALLIKTASEIDSYPEIKLCGIEKILDRGLKYMSTGEIRRTLLARALISRKQLLILSDPFAGLDVESRKILLDFFDFVTTLQLKNEDSKDYPHIILGMERWHEIPDAITNVIEFQNKEVSFCGTRGDYEKILAERESQKESQKEENEKAFSQAFEQTLEETEVTHDDTQAEEGEILVQMNNVNVGWSDHKVLRNVNWTLHKNEHWLVRGPNGSGKTTFLELITGDNQQVYCNDIHMFGIKRGSGETIWDIKKNLGIVSYRMHVEYRMLGGTSLLNVIVSGFRDSIGLYGAATDVEAAAATKWLSLAGFAGRENETFGNLSYGEQRAILIIRSAVKTPKILILDEPCHGLDENYRAQILQLIQLIAEQGTTTLLHVTHDPTEVLPCEKHILELHPDEDPMYKIIIND